MGRRQHAHVDRCLARVAHRSDGLLLDHAQQLYLHVQRQVRDFVQEKRAALGRVDQSLLVRHGAREAALLVAEQFAFHQLGRDRAAVDRHERPVVPRPRVVDQPRDQFLAGARVARDVDRRLAARDLGDHLPQLLHRLRLAQQPQARRHDDGLRGIEIRAVLGTQLQRRLDQLAQRAQVQRLGDEIESPQLERPHGRVDVAMRSDHRHWHARTVVLDPVDDVESVAVGKAHVREHEVEAFGAERLDRAGVVTRRHDLDLHAAERDGQQLADVGLVVDDQCARVRLAFGHQSFQRLGSAKMMRKMLPPPGRGS